MVTVALESPHQHEAIDLLHKSVAFIHSLYSEEHAHTFKLDELINNGRFVIARHNGNAIGCGAYVWRDQHEVELKHMYVEPLSRGLGCGKALLKFIEGAALSEGALRMVLETSKKQQEAVGLYMAFGYVVCDPYTEHHSEDIFMMKALLQEISCKPKPAAKAKCIRSRSKQA